MFFEKRRLDFARTNFVKFKSSPNWWAHRCACDFCNQSCCNKVHPNVVYLWVRQSPPQFGLRIGVPSLRELGLTLWSVKTESSPVWCAPRCAFPKGVRTAFKISFLKQIPLQTFANSVPYYFV